MNENENLIDQSSLAQTIADGLSVEFLDMFLVKPLEPIMVTKTFTKLPNSKTPTVDENGIEAIDVEETSTTETKEVPSDYTKAIVLKTPVYYNDSANQKSFSINIGDTVVFKSTSGRYYDLFKDSMLIKYYDIVGVEKC